MKKALITKSLKFKPIQWTDADRDFVKRKGEKIVSTEYGAIELIPFFTLYQEIEIPHRWILTSLLPGFSNKTYVRNAKDGKQLAKIQLGIFLTKFTRQKISK